MKIAIKGDKSRGKEVIQILESLGGENRYDESGSNEKFVYFINSIGFIYSVTQLMCSSERKVYTLEEFEKEFPFKVGDIVVTLADHKSYKIIALECYNDKLCYKLDNNFHYTPQILKPYKEMKEERNITLTLDKAKEWYKNGGELKEIALQAFSEKELNSLPKTWEEYCRRYGFVCLSTRYTNIPSKYDALLKLEQLRDCWRQNWVPNWSDRSEKWCIALCGNELSVSITTIMPRFLTFPTKEIAREFLKCFKDLIEKAGDLI